MAKICKALNCDNPVFNNKYGFCKYHLWMSQEYRDKRKAAEKGSYLTRKPLSSKKGTHIPPRKKKRLDQEIEYKKLYTRMDKEARDGGRVFCFFCDKEIKGSISHHHLCGRDNEHLTEEKYIVFSHNKCHVEDYHSKSVEQLRKLGWYDSFLERLLVVDEDLYNKELKKQDK